MNDRRETSRCALCGRKRLMASILGICKQCILDNYEAAEPAIGRAHALARLKFKLPLLQPTEGVLCSQCVNLCRIGKGESGYCGIRCGNGEAVVQTTRGAILEWYYDPLPTNCVAEFVCSAGRAFGNDRPSGHRASEHGHKNLAVFYGACNYSCLYCQNWQFRRLTKAKSPVVSAERLADKVDSKTSCVCYFGGDPTPQIEHAIKTSRIAMDRRSGVRICFETNGSMNRRYLWQAAELSYDSGGCIKFDLKTWNQRLNRALCGTDNRWTLNNFRWLADFALKKADRGVPLLVASTLLVPGYVEEEEVELLAGFIASLDENIPYSLLAFSPGFQMSDLPTTSKETAEGCLKVARAAGLRHVRLGNSHLMG